MTISMLVAHAVQRGFKAVASKWAAQPVAQVAPAPSAQVIPMPMRPALQMERQPAQGLQESAQIQAFLGQNHEALGRAVALRDPTERARINTLGGLRARFDNTVCCVVSRHAEHVHELEKLRVDHRDDDENLAQTDIAKKARLALAHNRERIASLEEQRRLAMNGAGWFGAVVAEFNAGFDRGLGESEEIRNILSGRDLSC